MLSLSYRMGEGWGEGPGQSISRLKGSTAAIFQFKIVLGVQKFQHDIHPNEMQRTAVLHGALGGVKTAGFANVMGPMIRFVQKVCGFGILQ